jgi:hypothetical protein
MQRLNERQFIVMVTRNYVDSELFVSPLHYLINTYKFIRMYLSIYLSIYIYLSFCLSLCLCVYLSVALQSFCWTLAAFSVS